MIPPALRKFIAFGSGIGIEIHGPRGEESFSVSAVRVRPNAARVAGGFTVEDFEHQPAAEWGATYSAFASKQGLQHVPATVILPRRDVIIRQLSLPGVSAKDLPAAVQFQMEGLHPYPDEDVVSSWAKLADGASVLVAITRQQVIQHYATLFAEAGVRVGSFTCSAAAIYSALRLFGNAPPAEILVALGDGEIYGESSAKPVCSAVFDANPERALAMAAADLRIENLPAVTHLANLLGADPALPFAAGLVSACPRLTLPLNLLPADQRQTSSPMAWVPATILGSLVVLLAGASLAFPNVENGRAAARLEEEIRKVKPAAEQAAALDRDIDATRRRIALLDDFRRRPKADMDALAEMTRILAPPAWLNSLDLNEQQVNVAGETDQASQLLKIIDASPLFEASEFTLPPLRIPTGESFRIHTRREGATH